MYERRILVEHVGKGYVFCLEYQVSRSLLGEFHVSHIKSLMYMKRIFSLLSGKGFDFCEEDQTSFQFLT